MRWGLNCVSERAGPEDCPPHFDSELYPPSPYRMHRTWEHSLDLLAGDRGRLKRWDYTFEVIGVKTLADLCGILYW